MIHPFEALCQFIRLFDAPRDPLFWIGMVEEETRELLDAMREETDEAVLKEASDLAYVCAGFYVTAPEDEFSSMYSDEVKERIEIALDEADNASRAFATGYPHLVDVAEEAFLRVHQSNLSKLDDDGNPIRRESDGKIMKGPNYHAPDLTDLVSSTP